MIPELELFSVLDATKIQDYQACPRRFFYERVLGWCYAQPNIHLIFGSSWHLAMEKLYEGGKPRYSRAENADLAALTTEAFNAFYTEYTQTYGPADEEPNKPKNASNAIRALLQYSERNRDDNFDVLHIETAGSIPVSDRRVLHFKTDLICHDERGYFSLEHKTSGKFDSRWAAQWRQKMQGGVYSHVLYCLYPPEDVYGVIINGAFITNPPLLKKDGTPRAGARDNEFHRVPIRKNLKQMEGWLAEVSFWFDCIERDHNTLASASDSDPVMLAFPKRTENCTNWGPCPFLDYCSVWNNPLQHIEEVPTGFEISHWDPRCIPNAKETIAL